MLQQPLRLGGLALACALATSVLVLVTFLASNLVLSVLGGLGGVAQGPAAGSGPEPPASAVLLSVGTDEAEDRAEQRCRSLKRPEVLGPTELLDRCAGQREGREPARP